MSRRSRRHLRQSPDRDGKGEHPQGYRVHGSHLLGRRHARPKLSERPSARPGLCRPLAKPGRLDNSRDQCIQGLAIARIRTGVPHRANPRTASWAAGRRRTGRSVPGGPDAPPPRAVSPGKPIRQPPDQGHEGRCEGGAASSRRRGDRGRGAGRAGRACRAALPRAGRLAAGRVRLRGRGRRARTALHRPGPPRYRRHRRPPPDAGRGLGRGSRSGPGRTRRRLGRAAGVSGGGAFAAACASELPDRVRSLLLVAPLGPPAWPTRGMAAGQRASLRIARHAPAFGGWFMGRLATLARRAPGLFVRLATSEMPAGDRLALAQPDERAAFLTDYLEAFHRGSRGVAQDLRVLTRPWGFDVESIRVPTSIHHGDADTTVPLQHGRRFAAAIPGARLHVHPGQGHFSILTATEQTLATLAA
ncbi:alpha/beta hydrolase [Actinacidiphila glaucinigra]